MTYRATLPKSQARTTTRSRPPGTLSSASPSPTIANEVSKVPDQIFENVAPQSTLGQLAATAGYTSLKVIVGAAMSPVDISAQTVTFSEDTRAVNIPILGPVADNLAKESSDFVDKPGWDTGLQVFGAASGAFLTAMAPVQGGRYFDAPGFKKSGKISVEDPSGSANKLDKPIEPDDVVVWERSENVWNCAACPEPERKIVRRFDSKKNIKKLKKKGMEFDPEKGKGIPTTSTNIDPVNPDKIREMTGARSADAYVDIDVTGKKILEIKTKKGHVEVRIQENIDPEDIVSGSGGRVKKRKRSK